MSFFIGNIVAKTINNVKSKVKNVKIQYKNFEQQLNMNKNNPHFMPPPRFIRANPYYWANKLKENFEKAIKALVDFKNKPKQISFEQSNNVPIIQQVHKVTNYTKQAALAIIEQINSLVLHITGGKLDVRKVLNGGLVPILNNFSLIVKNNINYHNLMIIYKKMGNQINKFNKETSNFMSRYRDPKAFEEYKRQYDNYLSKMNEQVRKGNSFNSKFNHFMKRFTPGAFFNFKTMTNTQMHKMDKFIKSPWYRQKIYTYEHNLRNFYNKFKSGEYFKYSFYQAKVNKKTISTFVRNINYQNTKNFFTGGIKRQFRKILFYMASFFVFYYSVKYALHRLFSRNNDKHLEDALKVVNDLKQQNEELMKYNRELVDKLILDRKNK